MQPPFFEYLLKLTRYTELVVLKTLQLSEDSRIGEKWNSKNGVATIITRKDDTYYVSYSDRPNTFHHENVNDIDRTILVDEDRYRHWIECMEQEKLDKENKQRELSEKQNDHGFTNNLTILRKGKVLAELDKSIQFRYNQYKIKELVELLVKSGWIINQSYNRNGSLIRGIEEPSTNRFITQATITKTGLDYAQYLINNRVEL